MSKDWGEVRARLLSRGGFRATVVLIVFVAAASMLLTWSIGQVRVTPGQIMKDTRLSRLDYQTIDPQMTKARRTEARLSAPQVWMVNQNYLDRLAAELNDLPKAVAGKQSIEEITPELRSEFQLTDDALLSLQAFAINGETTPRWKRFVNRMIDSLRGRRPLIARDEYQSRWSPRDYSKRLERLLRAPDGSYTSLADADAIEITPEMPADAEQLSLLVGKSGFPPSLNASVTTRLASNPIPTLLFDADQTGTLASSAAEAVSHVVVEHPNGAVIYRRGDHLTADQHAELVSEVRQFAAAAPSAARWTPRLAVAGLVTALGLLLLGSMATTDSPVWRGRAAAPAICTLMLAMAVLAVVVGVTAPRLAYLGAIGPTMLVAAVVLVTCGWRMALAASVVQSALVVVALKAGLGLFILLWLGCGATVVLLRRPRRFGGLIGTSLVLGVGLLVGAAVLELITTPIVSGAGRQIIMRALQAGLSGVTVAVVMIGITPTRWRQSFW